MPDDEHGVGLTNWEYGVLCEEMGRSPAIAPMAFNCSAPDTGNTEILAEHGTDEQKERWLRPLLDGEIRSCFSMTEPEVAGSDPRTLQTRAELDGRRVGDQRPQVVHLRRGRRLGRDRDGGHRPRRAPVRPRLDDPRADRHARLQPDPPRAGDGPRRRPRPLRDPLRGLPGAGGEPARPPPGRVRDRPGPARPRPHPPLHARDRQLRAGDRDDVPARQQRARRSARSWPRSSSSRTSSPSRGSRPSRPAC